VPAQSAAIVQEASKYRTAELCNRARIAFVSKYRSDEGVSEWMGVGRRVGCPLSDRLAWQQGYQI